MKYPNSTSLSLSAASIVFITCFALVVSAWLLARWRVSRHKRPLPPGPRTLPFIGNVAHMRQPEIWKAHKRLCDTYGDVVYVPVLGQSIVILGSPRAIFDLLDKRSSKTSDRLQSPLIPLVGQRFLIPQMPYGQWWRRHRRAFWQHFLPRATAKHLPLQHHFATIFLRKLCANPAQLCEHIRYTFAATVIKIVYGFDVEAENDPYIKRMEDAMEGLQAFTPGRYLVEYLPILQHIPGWVPGAKFQQEFAAWRAASAEARDALFQKTVAGLKDGSTSTSVLAHLIPAADGKDAATILEEEEIAKNVSLTAFEGGADTTFSTLQTFFLAMSLELEVQRKAQAELDAVVGPSRLPQHSDQAALPYISAIVKETLRWQTVLPIGVPHLTIEDIEYDGYHIPARTVLVPNTWACLNDPVLYPDPERFYPERFIDDGRINPEVVDPAQFMFGYGRRICPGRYFAETSLFINLAMVLHVFNIAPPLDAYGQPIRIEPKMTNGIMCYPEDCRCTITLRSDRKLLVIM
ncbi:CyP450 monooxygenase [Daedaleopsis nitida]|nr:CyP450 monooxygenase [Daedaleopsis nitida]